MLKPRPSWLLLVALLGGGREGGGGAAPVAFEPSELEQLAAREASNPELLQFSGGDGFLVLVIVLIAIACIGLAFLADPRGWEG